jgi:hypothetical protein
MRLKGMLQGICMAGACLTALVGYYENEPALYVVAIVFFIFVVMSIFGIGTGGSRRD